MNDIDNIAVEGAKVLVVGMAKSGVAAVELLLEHGARVRATDEKPQVPERLAELGVEFAPQSPAVFEGIDLIVISPGVPADLPELETARRSGT
ncbi:MAG TPA: hypothetical protein VJQ47_01025, partial [Steroidobacteraceae bacterium]|nr:hypothetical protein [Steroidobacteraceae bacterium]